MFNWPESLQLRSNSAGSHQVRGELLQALLPPPLRIQTFGGSAWLGVVPFRMEGVSARGVPDLPGLSAFPELNVRTYVEHEGKPGVWFFSLDATNRVAVIAARRFFDLPYHHADIVLQEADGEGVHYRHQRRVGAAAFEATYRPTGPAREARAGSLEHFLTERYCLYAASRDASLFRVDVHHVPWPLQPADAKISANTMVAPWNLALPPQAPLLHFARRMDVIVWRRERVVRGAVPR